MDIDTLRIEASKCTQCELHKGRINPVFDKGDPNSEIFICGMVPANEENKVGMPFVGRAGMCLDEVLDDLGLTSYHVYITNIVKCFLAPGIKLKPEWISSCIPYLITQIANVKPKVIITLGADATNGLMGFDPNTKIGETRGNTYKFYNIPVIPTYHPSYLIRGGGRKSPGYQKVISDFKMALSLSQKG